MSILFEACSKMWRVPFPTTEATLDAARRVRQRIKAKGSTLVYVVVKANTPDPVEPTGCDCAFTF